MATYSAGEASVTISPDFSGFVRDLRAHLDATDASLQVRLGIDAADFRGHLDELTRDQSVRIRADLDDAAARARLDDLTRDRTVIIRVNQIGDLNGVRGQADSASRSLSAMSAIKFAGLAAGIGALIPVIGGVAAAAGAAAGIFGGLAATIGLGSGGIADAFKAMGQEAKAGSQAAEDAAQKQVDSINAVVDAQNKLVDSQKAQQDSLQAITDAQTNLTQARQDAKDAQDNLNLSEKQGELAARGASLSYAEAAANLQKTIHQQALGKATQLDVQRAQLTVDSASQNTTDVNVRNQQNTQKTQQANALGVDNAPQVVAAQRAVVDAQFKAIDAQHATTDAVNALAKAQHDAAKAASDGLGGVNAFNEAMRKLSPNAQEFVRAMQALGPQFTALKKSIQDNLFAGLGGTVTRFFEDQKKGITDTLGGIATAINGAIKQTFGAFDDLFTKLEADGTMKKFVDSIGQALQGLAPFLTGVTQGFINLTTTIGPSFGPFLASLGAAFNQMSGPLGQLGKTFLDALTPLIPQLATFVGNLANGLAPILPTLAKLIGDLFTALNPVIKPLGDMVNTIGLMFDDIVKGLTPYLVPFVDNIDQLFKKLEPLIQPLATLAGVILLQLADAVNSLTGDDTKGSQGAAKSIGDLITAFAGLIKMLNAVKIAVELVTNPQKGASDLLKDVPIVGKYLTNPPDAGPPALTPANPKPGGPPALAPGAFQQGLDQLSQKQYDTAVQHLKDVQAKRAAGTANDDDVKQAQFEVDQAKKNLPAHRYGGLIEGPGTTTSDSILGIGEDGIPTARVSRKEWVTDAKTTARFMPLLQALPGLSAGGLVADDPQLGGGTVNKSIWDIVKAQFPTAVLDSGYRAGDPGFHGIKEAIDVGGPMQQVADFMFGTYKDQLAQIIWNAGPVWYNVVKNQLGNGVATAHGDAARSIYGAATMAQHGDHVHLAAEQVVNPVGGGVQGGSAGTSSTTGAPYSPTGTYIGPGGTSSLTVAPQAPLPGRRSDDQIAILSDKSAVDQANAERNQIYADPSSSAGAKQGADIKYQQAQNALDSAQKKGGLPEQYSLPGIASKGAGILAQGLLNSFGLGNSVLSSSNPYNNALSTTLNFYGQQNGQLGGSYAYQPQNPATVTTGTAPQVGTTSPTAPPTAPGVTPSVPGATPAAPPADSGVPSTGNAVKDAVRAVFTTHGWGSGQEWADTESLVQGESGWTPTIVNSSSGAFGLFQFLGSTKDQYLPDENPDPTVQAKAGAAYITDRYGDPSSAWSFWQAQSPHWYDNGGVASGVGLLMKNVIRPERVLNPSNTETFDSALPLLESINSGQWSPNLPQGLGSQQQQTQGGHDFSTHIHEPRLADVNDLADLVERDNFRRSIGFAAAL